MYSIRKMQSIAIAAAAFACLAIPGTLRAGNGGPPNVNYIAAATFSSPAIKGNDLFQLAGQPFTLTVTANEALKPNKFTKTSALYNNLAVTGTVNSGLLPGQPQPIPPGTLANLTLIVGATGKPDTMIFTFTVNVLGLPIIFSGKITMPAGTINNPAIRPFTAPVTLTPSNSIVTYACSSTCPPPYSGASTTLTLASGSLSTTVTSIH